MIKKKLLISVKGDKIVDLKKLRKAHNTRALSFAPKEDLYKLLKLKKGSVTLLGLLNEEKQKVLEEVENGVDLSKTFDGIDEINGRFRRWEKILNKEMLETMQETKNILSGKIERKEDESAKDLFEDLRI